MMFRLLFILSLTLLTVNSFGQKNDTLTNDTTIFADPLIYPSFPGGQISLDEYIKNNFKWTQGQVKVHGKVFVEFVVDTNGKIKEAKVIRGLCDTCDKEALRLVENMPTWIAGTENGKKVRTKMVLPIKFGQ